MRWIRDYGAPNLRDRSVVNCYIGTGIITDTDGPDEGTAPDFVRAVKLTLTKMDAAKSLVSIWDPR
ncbi:hypothetical protein AB0M36_32145 [Actinoplanes sp. NPDC051346]|uniref:hypothetical protein n=1 Tax=Actinoplanes sp. NPDC051346 TaxID=3155048 RepID=UPI0034247768